MQAQCLCQHHRQQVTESLTRARRYFAQAMVSGLRAFRRDQTEQAFRELGAAHEVARIMVVDHGCRHANDLQRYTDTAILLRELLSMHDMHELVGPFLRRFQADLASLARQDDADSDIRRFGDQVSPTAAINPMMFFATLDIYANNQGGCFDSMH